MNRNNKSSSIWQRRALRYGLAFVSVAAGFGLRVAFEAWVGPGLPTYVTFYPAVMVVALLAGFGPGLLATTLTGLTTAYWILSPEGFSIASPVDRVGLVLFIGMGLFMSAVAEFYRRDRRKAAAYDQEMALRETRREKEFLANLLEHTSQPFAVGYPDGRLGQLNHAFEQLTGYGAEELRAIDWAKTLTPPEWRELERHKLEELHRSGQPVRYEKEYVRKDGTRVPIELLVHLMKDAGGRPEYYYSFFTDITERKRTEEATRLLSGAVEASANGIAITDREGKILWINAAFTQLTGYASAEAVGQNPRALKSGQHPPEFYRHMWATILRGEVWHGELINKRKDGSLYPEEMTITPVRATGGEITHFIAVKQDITVRKRADEALKKAHAELEARVEERTAELHAASRYARSLLEASLDPLVTISPEGKVTDVNQATELVTGVPREQLIDSNFSDYFTEPDKANEGYQQVIREGLVRDYPLAIRHASGRVTDVLYNATVYRNEAGAVQGVFAAARDVTERKRMEAELRVASHYARSLIEASLDPLVTISAEGKVTDVNEASVQATGVPREQLIGTDFSNYFTEPDKAREGYRRVFAEGFVRDYPLAIRHASGRVTDVLYNATVYRNEAGAVQGVFAAARDITEHKRAEAELARYRDHLEEIVKLRTAELARSNQDLEQFAYVASHDLQEPLRAVGGYVKLLQHRFPEKLDAKAREYVTGAADGAERMQRLITDLLAFSRVGTRGGAFAPADLNALLRDALNNLQASIAEAGAKVTSDPLPSLPVDATQIVQLFQNLIGNAIKFHSDLTPVIHVGARRENEQWLFWVRDNGIGIEPQYAGRIFQIFQRLHSRKHYPGTGIGLAICKKIVERHGGEIRVESEPAQGSTFCFSIPEVPAKKENAL